MSSAPEPREIEIEDEVIELPSVRRAWLIASALLLGGGAIVWLMITGGQPRLRTGAFIVLTCFGAPFVAGLGGDVSLDRAVPFGAALGVLAVIFFNVVGGIAAEGELYDWSFDGAESLVAGKKRTALMYLMAFAAPPTVSILGAVFGCKLAQQRAGQGDDDDLGI